MQRLGVDALDIVFVHDLSPDNPYLGSSWEEQFEIARKGGGAFSALTRMREEGIIKGWGLGVNRPEPIMKLLDVADPDVCLLASQYSLIDHENALHHVGGQSACEAFFPDEADRRGVAIHGTLKAIAGWCLAARKKRDGALIQAG